MTWVMVGYEVEIEIRNKISEELTGDCEGLVGVGSFSESIINPCGRRRRLWKLAWAFGCRCGEINPGGGILCCSFADSRFRG